MTRTGAADEIVAAPLDVIRTGTHADNLRAIENWTGRVYGKPTERVEVGPQEPETVADIRAMSGQRHLSRSAVGLSVRLIGPPR